MRPHHYLLGTDRPLSGFFVSRNELTGRTITESLVRVSLIVVCDPTAVDASHGLDIWSRASADVVTLDRADEGFSHSITLRTFDGRRSRFEPDVTNEASRISGNIAAAVVHSHSMVIGKR